MKLSSAGLELVKKSEGFRGKVYLDVAGLPTIGYGDRLVHPECYPDGICETQAEVILLWDAHEAEQAVSRQATDPGANSMHSSTSPSTSVRDASPLPPSCRI